MVQTPADSHAVPEATVDRVVARFHRDRIIREAVREGKVLYERAA